jgi:plastocyanin
LARPSRLLAAPGRNVIVVELTSNEKGNFFEPNEIEAKKGEVMRFTIKVGVDNVHFLPDSKHRESRFASSE